MQFGVWHSFYVFLDFIDSIFELSCKIGVCEIHGDLFLPNFVMKD